MGWGWGYDGSEDKRTGALRSITSVVYYELPLYYLKKRMKNPSMGAGIR